MKAAILQQAGQSPVYRDFADPTPALGESLVRVAASAIRHIVNGRASGRHYSSSDRFPFVVGIDGVGRLDDGRRVYFVLPRDPFGSMAEQTVIATTHCLPLPDDLDDITAAAIANPGMSCWAAFKERAKLVRGETVLINGDSGTSGRLAVQVARNLGAGKIIATGRNVEALKAVASLGADVTIPLVEDTAEMDARFREQFAARVDVVIDYLWGKSAERLLVAAAKEHEEGAPLRYVEVGALSGSEITLPATVLRSSAITLMGSGLGSVPEDRLVANIGELLRAVVPGGFTIANTPVPLAEVEHAWPRDDSTRRTVFTL